MLLSHRPGVLGIGGQLAVAECSRLLWWCVAAFLAADWVYLLLSVVPKASHSFPRLLEPQLLSPEL